MPYTVSRRNAIDVIEALAAHLAGRAVLVDVREEHERARGFPPGSLHLPLSRLRQRLHELPSDAPILFLCESGRRSAMATTAARRAGLNARNVSGGMAAWERKGLDLEKPDE